MYRWFLIFALLNFADSADLVSRISCRGNPRTYCRPSKARHYGHPHNYYHGNGQTEAGTPDRPTVQPLPPANTFEDLAQNLAAAESAVRKYCLKNSNGDVKEVFGADTYIIKYTLRDFKKSDINVKIKHRVIYVTASSAGVAPFKDLRILPSNVNTRLASWTLENKYLKVVIPYNVEFRREAENKCGDVNDAIIEVPSMRPILQLRTNESQQNATEKKVETPTSTAQPETTTNDKKADTIAIDDVMSIISPPEYFDMDVRNAQM